MKVDARRVDAFLRDPGACRVVLLHGEDVGLVRERAGRLVLAVAGSRDDPFRVAELDPQSFGRIPAEVASGSLTGGRRVVRVRDATDGVLPHVQAALAGPGEGLLVLEAGALVARGKLRLALERAADAAVIACYPLEGAALDRVIGESLAQREVTIDGDAKAWLVEHLGADQIVTRSEMEKLALYAGVGGRVDLEAARTCVGDLAGLSLDDALFSATAGDVAATDRALELALAEGVAPVRVVRAGLQHCQRLHRARLAMAEGASASEAAKELRPPIFYRREAEFVRALTLWPALALQAASERFWEAERACKRTGSPDETICRSAVLGLAQRGAVLRRR